MTAGRFLTFILAAVGLICPISLSAGFPNGLATESVDPQRDSAAFAAMRQKMAEIRKERPAVGLVLSGGGAKGACEIGVMRYLEEKGIPVDLVVGTSMGSLIGGLYSVGYDAAQIDSIISGLDWSRIMSDNRSAGSGLRPIFSSAQNDGYIHGDNVYGLLSALTAGYQDSLSFKDLPIPYACVATDILTTRSVNWCEGELLDAMRSSMALPVIFTPLRKNGMVMLDGGMRNNFPVDIARAMGADIVIGVDVGDHTTMENLDGMAGIVIESLSSMGVDAYRANRPDADVFIRPEMEPYGTMSWANADIDTLIRRGYEAAASVGSRLDSVASLTGRVERALFGRAAVDLRGRNIAIGAVSIRGVDEKGKKYFSHICKLRSGEKIPLSEIEETIADLYAGGAFKSVTYRLLGKEEPYDLVFVCERNAGSQFGMALRVDTEEAVSLLARGSFGVGNFYGSRLDLNLKASLNPYLEAEYTFRSIAGPDFGASTKIHFVDCLGTRYWHNDNRIFLKSPVRRSAFWRAGARFQPMPESFSAFAEGGCDTRDDKYFPTGGIKAGAGYEYVFGGSGGHIANLSLEGAIACGRILTIIPSMSARAIMGCNGPLPYYLRNYVGGAMSGRFFDQQIAMASYTHMREAEPLAAVASFALRFNLFKNFYLDGSAQALVQAETFDKFQDTVWGCSIRASYNTFVGPLAIDLHWNSDTHTVGSYLTLGFNF